MTTCKWILNDYYVVPQHNIEDFYWVIPLQMLATIKYCPYCGKQIIVVS